jgi:phosphatidylglycerophosphatase A
MTRLALAIATVGGAGYFPKAPGTIGSAIGVGVYLLTDHWSPLAQTVLLLVVTIAGMAAASRAATAVGRKDPGIVVIDEVAGQLATLLWTGAGGAGVALGFLLFRALDIIKPWPAGRFEQLPGGLGIMADDLMAGLYGNLLMIVALHYFPVLS